MMEEKINQFIDEHYGLLLDAYGQLEAFGAIIESIHEVFYALRCLMNNDSYFFLAAETAPKISKCRGHNLSATLNQLKSDLERSKIHHEKLFSYIDEVLNGFENTRSFSPQKISEYKLKVGSVKVILRDWLKSYRRQADS